MHMLAKIAGAAILAGSLVTGAAQAQLVGAKTIRVTNAYPTWLQVGEVVAIQDITNINVALAANGATATGSGNYDGASNPGEAIDGVFPAGYPSIYHSDGTGADEFLEIELAASYDLASLTLYGRADGFGSRDLFSVTIFDAAGDSIFTRQFDNRALAGGANLYTFARLEPSVPEPATWAMLITGFGLIGSGLRRQRRRFAAA